MKIPKFINWKPLLLYAFINISVYCFTPLLLNENTIYYSCETFIDKYIPFISLFVIPYLLCYIQWAYFYLKAATIKSNKKYLYMLMLAQLIGAFFFIFFPTKMARPQPNGPLSFIVEFVYKLDEPTRLFPSFHCLISTMVTKCELETSSNKYHKIFSICFSLLVYASTVLIKQHCFIDILGGIIASLIGSVLYELLKKKYEFN